MCKILLVDDEEIERIVLKKFLSNLDSVTIIGEAESGKGALEKFDVMDPDIVIMDIKMPGIDGLETAKKMKRLNQNCIIIFLTAYLEEEKIRDCIFFGGEAYLQKPVRQNDLFNTINSFRASEKRESAPPDYDKLLIEKIVTKNYKASKHALSDLIEHQKDKTCESLIDLKMKYQKIATEIIGTLELMNIEKKGIKVSGKELMSEITLINDRYLLQSWLFKVLDYVFNVIVLDQKGFPDNEINVILNYLEKYYYRRITLEEVAEYINISPFYLSKIFKKHTGINFIDYLTDLKIEKAKELLEYTEMPVVNIAIELSFNEPNYFTRVFRKTVGMTPSKYREIKRETVAAGSKVNEIKWYV